MQQLNQYRTFRGHIVEQMADGRMVDPVIMAMTRHHAETDEERSHIIEFCSVQGFDVRHLNILLLNMGRRTPFLGLNVMVRAQEDGRMVTCTTKLNDSLFWSDNRLKCDDSVLPETIRTTMRGKGLGHLVEHPYLPKDLPLASITQGKTHWVAMFNVNRKAAKPVV